MACVTWQTDSSCGCRSYRQHVRASGARRESVRHQTRRRGSRGKEPRRLAPRTTLCPRLDGDDSHRAECSPIGGPRSMAGSTLGRCTLGRATLNANGSPSSSTAHDQTSPRRRGSSPRLVGVWVPSDGRPQSRDRAQRREDRAAQPRDRRRSVAGPPSSAETCTYTPCRRVPASRSYALVRSDGIGATRESGRAEIEGQPFKERDPDIAWVPMAGSGFNVPLVQIRYRHAYRQSGRCVR